MRAKAINLYAIHDILGGLLKEFWETWDYCELLGHLGEVVLARGVLETTSLEFLLVRGLLRRCSLGKQALIIKVSVISPSLIIAVTVTI